ncbi:MAG: hypothetical protein H7257_05300 [Taibaiella sp.]|nr:hypothetical protein [Taibaiella sp.]
MSIIKTEEQYQQAVLRTLSIFHAEEGTNEADELALLLLLVKDYEDRIIHLPDISLLDIVRLKMQEKGIIAKDLEAIIGSKGHVSSVLAGRREITLKMAKRLKDYFHLPAEVFFA